MKVLVKDIEIKNDYEVYHKGIHIGGLRTFCCGTDFRFNVKAPLFSIMLLKPYSPRIKRCIASLMSIKLPKNGHFNFNYKTAIDKQKLKEYESVINKSDKK